MTNKLDIELEQVKFEEWATENACLTLMQTRFGYALADTANAWRAWLARAELESKQECAAVIEIRRSRYDGTPEPKITSFTDLGDGEHKLYCAPQPPEAKDDQHK